MGACLGPTQLTFGKAFADHGVDGRFYEPSRRPFTVAVSLGVVRDRRGIIGDVGLEAVDVFSKGSDARIVGFNTMDIVDQPIDPAARSTASKRHRRQCNLCVSAIIRVRNFLEHDLRNRLLPRYTPSAGPPAVWSTCHGPEAKQRLSSGSVYAKCS